jgi:hypothetical protein
MNASIENMSQERDHEIVQETVSTTDNNTYSNSCCVYISKSEIDTLYLLSTIFEGIILTICVHTKDII